MRIVRQASSVEQTLSSIHDQKARYMRIVEQTYQVEQTVGVVGTMSIVGRKVSRMMIVGQ